VAKKTGIKIFGVTKATCGDVKVAQAMLDAGCTGISDSRISNIKNMKKEGIITTFMQLRTPMISEIEEVVKYSDISLNTELKVIKKLSEEAVKQKKKHKIILMVEMGDLREGIPENNLDEMITKIKNFDGIEIYGIGMNLACFGGVVPTHEKIGKFLEIVEKNEKKHSLIFKMISA